MEKLIKIVLLMAVIGGGVFAVTKMGGNKELATQEAMRDRLAAKESAERNAKLARDLAAIDLAKAQANATAVKAAADAAKAGQKSDTEIWVGAASDLLKAALGAL